nr:hypothetical protein [Tanacetum cinerariifolium]
MQIPLLYRGEYSQWRERFMNYLEEQTDGEAMINYIQNGDQPLSVIAQVSLVGNAQNAPPTLKDPKFWTAEEKKTRKIDRFARSLLIQGLSNDIYSLIDSNKTAKDLWDALERQTKNLMDINIDSLYNILKKNQGDVNDALGYKKKAVVETSDPLALVAEKTKVSKHKEKVKVQTESKESDEDITNKKPEYVKSVEKKEDKKANEKKKDMSKVKCYNCKKEGHFAKDCKKAKDQAWMESSSDSDQEINANIVFIAQIEKVLSDLDESSSFAEETIAKQTSLLKPYVPTVILKKIIIDLEHEVVSLLEKEKANLEKIESLKSKCFESSENAISETENQSENDCQVVEKECDNMENPKVIAHGMFKLSVSQSVSPISMLKTSCDSKNVENKTKRKRRKRKSSKQNDKQVNNDVSRANSDFVYFSDLDTFGSVRRPKQSSVIWKKKGPSNTSNADLSSVSHSKLNKDVKRYSRKYLLSCNNSHLGETSSAYDCNDAMNISCNSRLYDSFDENNLFIFDDEVLEILQLARCLLGKILLIL